MREYLEPFEIKDDKGNVTETARMQIFSNCKNFIKYLPMLQHDEHNPEDAADKPHIVSHINESCLTGDTIVNTTDGDIGKRGY